MATIRRTTTTIKPYSKDLRTQLPLRIVIPLIMQLTNTPFEYHYIVSGTEDKLVFDSFDGLYFGANNKDQQIARYKVHDYIQSLCKDLYILSDD